MTPPRHAKILCVTAHPDLPEAWTMIGLAQRGYTVRTLCDPAARNYALLDSSPVATQPLAITQRFDAAAVAAIRDLLVSFEPDVLHLFNNRAVLNGLRAARGLAVKIVVYRGNVGNVSVLDPLAWLRYLNPRVDRIVCVAEAVRASLLAVGFPGCRIAPSKLVTIYKGHDLAWYAAPPVPRSALGVPDDAFLVGCVANWRPRKGIERLVEAVARIASDLPIHLALVGDMTGAKLEQQIDALGLTARVHLLGPRDDASQVAGAFDVAVLPATKREGLPKTVIEAMARGVATVASCVGGVPEIIASGVNGLIVRPGDVAALAEALLGLYRDPAMRTRLASAGRERIATAFRIEDTIEQTATLYESLHGGSR